LASYPKEQVIIINAFIKEEHPDNRRFLADCEVWFGHPVTVLQDEKYGASVRECWRKSRFINNRLGAKCSVELKHKLLDNFSEPQDYHVIGYTLEETCRANRIGVPNCKFPLIERSLFHADCTAMIERAGLVLPMMYRLGYNNANCIGCCKGGMGYWNKIRVDFPNDFEQVADIEESLGPTAYILRNRKTGERRRLRDLPVDEGRHSTELPSCSFYCGMAEQEFADYD
jgi:hypothetical protein